MQRFYADKFVTVLNLLHGIQFAIVTQHSSVALDTPAHAYTLKLQISEFAKQLEALRMPMTRRSVLELFDTLKNPLPDKRRQNDLLAQQIAAVCFRLRDEFEVQYFLKVDLQELFERCHALFGSEFAAKFPSALFDVDEAGKCLALARPTASVFHLMRVMETSVRAVARCLGIADPLKPAERNWGHVLREIKNGIDARWPSGAARHSGDGALFESLYVSLDAVRNPWRNATMHIESKYTEEEAEHILSAVKGFVVKLASRMDEQGMPLA